METLNLSITFPTPNTEHLKPNTEYLKPNT